MTKQTNATPNATEYAARFGAEKAALQQHYCNAFKFWRLCPLRRCRRVRTCSGNAEACLKRREREIPRDIQWQARLQILLATPADAGPAERTARGFLPDALI